MIKVGDAFYSGRKAKIEIQVTEVLENGFLKIKYIGHPRPERQGMEIVCSEEDLLNWKKFDPLNRPKPRRGRKKKLS